MNAEEARELFEDELPLVENIIRAVCRRRGLTVDDRQEFYSWSMLKLIEDDYARIRKYRGLSSLGTYLNTVVQRLYLDFRIHHWGKWRASTAAKSLGSVACELERLIYRDGRDFDEAAKILASRRDDGPSRELLWGWYEQFPYRAPRRVQALVDVDIPGELPDDVELGRERASMQVRLAEDLQQALSSLSEDENLIVRMSVLDGLPAHAIGKALQLKPSRVFAKRKKGLDSLRSHMADNGWVWADVDSLMGWSGFDVDVA